MSKAHLNALVAFKDILYRCARYGAACGCSECHLISFCSGDRRKRLRQICNEGRGTRFEKYKKISKHEETITTTDKDVIVCTL